MFTYEVSVCKRVQVYTSLCYTYKWLSHMNTRYAVIVKAQLSVRWKYAFENPPYFVIKRCYLPLNSTKIIKIAILTLNISWAHSTFNVEYEWTLPKSLALRRKSYRLTKCCIMPKWSFLTPNNACTSAEIECTIFKLAHTMTNNLHCFQIFVHYAVLSKLTALILNYVRYFHNRPGKGVHSSSQTPTMTAGKKHTVDKLHLLK